MSDKNLNQILGEFKSDDLTVKFCSGIFSAIPGGPPFVFYNSLQGAAERLAPGNAGILTSALEISSREEMKKALWVADVIDTADAGLSIYAGVKNLLGLFGSGSRQRTFEADPQQALDCAVKAAAMAYMIHKMFPGGIADQIKLFREIPAGQELATYYAVGEVALPFADNLVEGGANLVSRILDKHRGELTSKVTSVLGMDALNQAQGVLSQFTAPLGTYIDQAKAHTPSIIGKIQRFLPSGGAVANIADSATGALATGLDLMSAWRFLGGRAVAEACVLRAMKGI